MTESFTTSELTTMPSNAVEGLKKTMSGAMNQANAKAQALQKEVDNLTGMMTLNFGDLGGITSVPAVTGFMGILGMLAAAAAVVMGAKAAVESLVGQGKSAYTNMSNPSSEVLASVGSKLDKTMGPLQEDPLKATQRNADIQNAKDGLTAAYAEINTIKSNVNLMDNLLDRRAKGLEEEPQINYDALDASGGGGYSKEFLELMRGNVITPYLRDLKRLMSLRAQSLGFDDTPQFDLVFGPPISMKGQYVLSQDGLYYDSRTIDTLPSPRGTTKQKDSTSFDYAPNLGGRGEVYDEGDLNWFNETVMDFETVKETEELLNYYHSDNILQGFEEDKGKQAYDISGQIQELITSGHSATGALVINFQQSLDALNLSYKLKIKKRKKQLELARLSGKFSVENNTVFFFGDEGKQVIDHVPLNDFTYLRGTGYAPSIDQQTSITLGLGDVDDSVLPLSPTFLQTIPAERGRVFGHLALSQEGKGFGVGNSSTAETSNFDVSGKGAFSRSITDSVVTKDLLAGYSFLSPLVVSSSLGERSVENFAVHGLGDVNARLIGPSDIEVYPSGLSIPFLKGTDLENNGAFVEIPATESLVNMFYLDKGFTISYWVYLPTLNSGNFFDSDHQYRLCISNENTGDGGQTPTSQYVTADTTIPDSKVKGFMAGFKDNGSNKPKFFVTTTVSQNERRNGWEPGVCFAEDSDRNRMEFSWEYPELYTDVSSGYHMFTLVGNNRQQTVELFYDNSSVATSSMVDVFGQSPLKVPTFLTDDNIANTSSYSALEGKGSTIPSEDFFTPFILGGGFTDTLASGFMGANTNTYYSLLSTTQEPTGAGIANAKSGLNGHMGLPLFYGKALTTKQIKRNYRQTKNFFTNIKIT